MELVPYKNTDVAPDRLDLLEAVREGDKKALATLLRELLPSVRRWLFRLLGPRPDLDDATQDALIALTKALPRFQGNSKVETFAHTVTVRVAYRYYKKRDREEPLTLVPPAPETIDPESVAINREALRRLHRCLERLPDKKRIAFVLCAVEGMSPAEAARIEGVTSVVMRARLSSARKEVTRRLSADPYVQALVERKARSRASRRGGQR